MGCSSVRRLGATPLATSRQVTSGLIAKGWTKSSRGPRPQWGQASTFFLGLRLWSERVRRAHVASSCRIGCGYPVIGWKGPAKLNRPRLHLVRHTVAICRHKTAVPRHVFATRQRTMAIFILDFALCYFRTWCEKPIWGQRGGMPRTLQMRSASVDDSSLSPVVYSNPTILPAYWVTMPTIVRKPTYPPYEFFALTLKQ